MESLFESFIQALMRQVRGPVLCRGHLLQQNITTARKIPRRIFLLLNIIFCVSFCQHIESGCLASVSVGQVYFQQVLLHVYLHRHGGQQWYIVLMSLLTRLVVLLF